MLVQLTKESDAERSRSKSRIIPVPSQKHLEEEKQSLTQAPHNSMLNQNNEEDAELHTLCVSRSKSILSHVNNEQTDDRHCKTSRKQSTENYSQHKALASITAAIEYIQESKRELGCKRDFEKAEEYLNRRVQYFNTIQKNRKLTSRHHRHNKKNNETQVHHKHGHDNQRNNHKSITTNNINNEKLTRTDTNIGR